MTNEEIIEKIRTTLAEEFEIDVELIQPDAPLMQTLELDSLDLVDMVVLIDRNFGFTVTAKDFAGIRTFQDFYNLVISHIQKATTLSTSSSSGWAYSVENKGFTSFALLRISFLVSTLMASIFSGRVNS